MNSYIYQKPEGARYNLTRILGNGVLVVEEEKHKQQVSDLELASTELRIWFTDYSLFAEKDNGKRFVCHV